MRIWTLLFAAFVLLLPLVSALPDEAKGNVTYVTDGDTLTVDGLGVIRLADVNSPELSAAGGPEAKEYTRSMLLGKLISLDLDNETGVDRYGRSVALVYLINADGSPGENFNCLLVASGHAVCQDMENNEFAGADCDLCRRESVFVGSSMSNKYHYPECRWAEKIAPENEVWFDSPQDAKSKGYLPCGVCHPPA